MSCTSTDLYLGIARCVGCVCNVHEGADKTERECESEHEVSRDVIAQIIAA